MCVYACVLGVLFMVAGMVGSSHKVNKVIYWMSCSITMLFPQDRVSLSLELGGSQQKHFLSLLLIVLSIDTVEVGSGSSSQPHVPKNKTQTQYIYKYLGHIAQLF